MAIFFNNIMKTQHQNVNFMSSCNIVNIDFHASEFLFTMHKNIAKVAKKKYILEISLLGTNLVLNKICNIVLKYFN